MKYFLTTPIYYVNGPPHIGSAYTTLAADVLARAHRANGDDVSFLVGTDEHGAKIAQQAKEAGKEPQEFVDEIASQFRATWDLLGIKYDIFARTTDPKHEHLVTRVVSDLHERGVLYPGTYEGWYCVACEEYKDIPADEKGPICDIHGKPLEFITEEIYYFALSKYQKDLTRIIESDELLIQPLERKHEVLSFIKTGLKDIPVTRSKVDWGIKVPFAREQTVYVWVDALLNYLTFAGVNIDANELGCWPAELQVIGKDILRFHAVIWPAMLLALGLPLPKKLFVHGFFTVDGEKMSKTLGNIIRPQELVDRYGVEATRYLIVSAVPWGADGDISLAKLDTTYTADLANGLGNLLQRTIILIKKHGIKPQVDQSEATEVLKKYLANDLTGGLKLTNQLITDANRYLATEQPWALDNDALRETVLVKTVEQLLEIASALEPVMPETAKRIRQQLEILEPQPLFPRLDN